MSWTCPHQINNECIRLRKSCQPLQNGCVLDGKVICIDNQSNIESKKDFRKDDDQDGKIRSHCGIQRRPQKGKGRIA